MPNAAAPARFGASASGSATMQTVSANATCMVVTSAAGVFSLTSFSAGMTSAAELDAYLATGEPLAVAGAFTLDGLGGWFVNGIDGDPSSVIGISLPLTRKLLAEVGVSVVELWNRK